MDVTEDIEERMSKLSKRMDNDVLITENKKDFFVIVKFSNKAELRLEYKNKFHTYCLISNSH